MTSKEFSRRCDFFALFDNAALFFIEDSQRSFIYKFSCYGDSFSSESYGTSLLDLNDFVAYFPVNFDLLYVERFTRSQFDSQFKYFLNFLSRLSERQMNSLVSSCRFEHLLKIKDEMSE